MYTCVQCYVVPLVSVGARQSMHATLSELREEYGAPPDEEEDDGKFTEEL